MGKKQLFKQDGTEDFEAESKEVDETAAAPGLLDELKPEGEGDEKKDDGASTLGEATDSSTSQEPGDEAHSDELAPKATDEKAEHPDSPHTPAEQEPSQADTVNVEPAIEAKDEPSQAAAPDAAAAPVSPSHVEPKQDVGSDSDKPEEPAPFSALHDEVNDLAEHLGMDALDELRKAGDAITPAVSKLHGIEKELHKLGDEAKARFTFAKAKVVEAMGALERLFKRG